VGAWTAERIQTDSHAGTGVTVAADAEAAALAEVERRVAAGSSRGDAARTVAAETGISRRKLYRVGVDGR
jgi:hypothetical protein